MKNKRRHCLYCGGQVSKKKEDGVSRDFCPACNSFFYDNPLPVVSSIVDSSRQILLVKRNRAPFKGHWCLPTGFAEAKESIEEAALRELQEETGIKGKISRLLDVDSYKSRYYGDLLFLTFVVEQTGGSLRAGDDCAEARYWPINKIPPLAFRPNRHALESYIRSKKNYWTIVDSLENKGKNFETSRQAHNSLTRHLVHVITKNSAKIINQWIKEVTTSQTTMEYHLFEKQILYTIGAKIISQIVLWMENLYDSDRIKSFFIKLGQERNREKYTISGALSALSLIRKHIWDVALKHDVWEKKIDLYMSFELQRRMTIFFDLATFYLTCGYESQK